MKNPNVVYHTNHALVNHDVKPWYEEYHKQILDGKVRKNSTITRFEAVQAKYSVATDHFVDLAINTLRSKDSDKYPVCITYNPNKGAHTLSSVVFTQGTKPTVEVTLGSPD